VMELFENAHIPKILKPDTGAATQRGHP
jgi:hypothetical protein